MIFQESEQIELKEIFIPEIKKEVVAFANSDGGTVYIGINDDGQFTGLLVYYKGLYAAFGEVVGNLQPVL